MRSVALSRTRRLSSRVESVCAPLLSATLRRTVSVLDRATARIDAELPLLEAALGRLDPTLSLRHVRARVVAVIDETHDVKTFVLRPNARFDPAYRPGSYVTLRLVVDGKPVQRSYSISSAPSEDGLFAITVKRVPGGRVSGWLFDNLGVGSVLSLGAPQGQFVLPAERPEQLLMISAGSGITPVMAMLRQLIRERNTAQIDFLHFARSPRDVIFQRELAQIAERHPNVRVTLCVESADEAWQGERGRFEACLLARVAPDFHTRATYLCGPAGFMQAVMQTLEEAQADLSKLRYERFTTEVDPRVLLDGAQVVRFMRSGTEGVSTRPITILEQAESLGLPVESGCRAGNCGTCRCLKLRGVVVDTITGALSGEGEEYIFPCVSVARGTVEVGL